MSVWIKWASGRIIPSGSTATWGIIASGDSAANKRTFELLSDGNHTITSGDLWVSGNLSFVSYPIGDNDSITLGSGATTGFIVSITNNSTGYMSGIISVMPILETIYAISGNAIVAETPLRFFYNLTFDPIINEAVPITHKIWSHYEVQPLVKINFQNPNSVSPSGQGTVYPSPEGINISGVITNLLNYIESHNQQYMDALNRPYIGYGICLQRWGHPNPDFSTDPLIGYALNVNWRDAVTGTAAIESRSEVYYSASGVELNSVQMQQYVDVFNEKIPNRPGITLPHFYHMDMEERPGDDDVYSWYPNAIDDTRYNVEILDGTGTLSGIFNDRTTVSGSLLTVNTGVSPNDPVNWNFQDWRENLSITCVAYTMSKTFVSGVKNIDPLVKVTNYRIHPATKTNWTYELKRYLRGFDRNIYDFDGATMNLYGPGNNLFNNNSTTGLWLSTLGLSSSGNDYMDLVSISLNRHIYNIKQVATVCAQHGKYASHWVDGYNVFRNVGAFNMRMPVRFALDLVKACIDTSGYHFQWFKAGEGSNEVCLFDEIIFRTAKNYYLGRPDLNVYQSYATGFYNSGLYVVGTGNYLDSITGIIYLRNDGASDLTVTSVVTSGAVSLVNGPLESNLVITSGTQTGVLFSMNSSVVGLRQGMLSIGSNDPEDTTFIINLSAYVQGSVPAGVEGIMGTNLLSSPYASINMIRSPQKNTHFNNSLSKNTNLNSDVEKETSLNSGPSISINFN